MKLTFSVTVEQDYQTVWKGFNENLFRRLSPSFPRLIIHHFGGCNKGNTYALELDFFFFSQRWNGSVVDEKIDNEVCFFIDRGDVLPFFLSKWKHKHLIIKDKDNTIIRDEVEFSSPFGWLMIPAIYFMFTMRKPIYKKLFKR